MTPIQFFGCLGLPGGTTSVPAARHFVRDVLTGTGFDRIDDAELLVSEVVSNALAHVGGALSVTVTRSWADVLVEVTDRGAPDSRPCLQPPPDGQGPGGFGLILVDELASGWGSYTRPDGPDGQGGCQVVWFTLPHPDATALRGRGPMTFEELFAFFQTARAAADPVFPPRPRRPGRAVLPTVSGKQRS